MAATPNSQSNARDDVPASDAHAAGTPTSYADGDAGRASSGARTGAAHGSPEPASRQQERVIGNTGAPPSLASRAGTRTVGAKDALGLRKGANGHRDCGDGVPSDAGREHASNYGSPAASGRQRAPSASSAPSSPTSKPAPTTAAAASASPAGGAHGETLLYCSVDASHRGKVGFFYRQWVCVACKCFFYRHVRDQRNGVPISKQSDPARFAQCLKSGMDPTTVLIRSSSGSAAQQHARHNGNNASATRVNSLAPSAGLLASRVTGASAAMSTSLHPLLAAAGLRPSVLGGGLRAQGLGISSPALRSQLAAPMLSRQAAMAGAPHDTRLGHGGIMPSMFRGMGPRAAASSLVLDAHELAAGNARYAMTLSAQLRQHHHGAAGTVHSDGASPGSGAHASGFPSPTDAGATSGHAFGRPSSFHLSQHRAAMGAPGMHMGAGYGMGGGNVGMAQLQQMRLAHGGHFMAYQQLVMLRQMQQRRAASFQASPTSASVATGANSASVASGSSHGVRGVATITSAVTHATTADCVATSSSVGGQRAKAEKADDKADRDVFSPPPAASPARLSAVSGPPTSRPRAPLTVDTLPSGPCLPVPGASPASLTAPFLTLPVVAHAAAAARTSTGATHSAPGNLLQLLAAVSSADTTAPASGKRGKRPRPCETVASGRPRSPKRPRGCSTEPSRTSTTGAARVGGTKPDSPSSAASVAASA